MKYNKRLLLTPLILLLATVLLVGCSSPIAANFIALDFYELIVKQNDKPIIEVGLSEEVAKTTTTHITTTLKQNIQSALTTEDGVMIDETQLKDLTEAYLSALHQLNATAIVTSSENSKKCTVKLSTSYLDHKAIDDVAVKTALKTIDISTYKDENLYLQDLTNTYIDELIKGYKSSSPSTDVHTQSFEFKLENKIWIPVDYAHFLSSICTMITSDASI